VVEVIDLKQRGAETMVILNTKYRSLICALIVIASTLLILSVNTVAQTRPGHINKIDTKDRVKFHSGTTSKDQSGNPADIIYGQLFKPTGDGPFPAFVLLHDCIGLHITHKKWAERLVEWGYVALLVDSFGPRGLENCFQYTVTGRGEDAYGALKYLGSVDFVDANRVGLLGWSNGGWAVLTAVSSDFQEFFNVKRKFKAAIAYYPQCPRGDFYAPVLVFFGEDDVLQTWFSTCKEAAKERRAEGKSFEMKTYPGASHAFDYGFNSNWRGKPLNYDPVAEKDAIERVKAFLDKHF
jgi:dienelactone hydrolase